MVRECQIWTVLGGGAMCHSGVGAKKDPEEANGPGFQNGLEECME